MDDKWAVDQQPPWTACCQNDPTAGQPYQPTHTHQSTTLTNERRQWWTRAKCRWEGTSVFWDFFILWQYYLFSDLFFSLFLICFFVLFQSCCWRQHVHQFPIFYCHIEFDFLCFPGIDFLWLASGVKLNAILLITILINDNHLSPYWKMFNWLYCKIDCIFVLTQRLY